MPFAVLLRSSGRSVLQSSKLNTPQHWKAPSCSYSSTSHNGGAEVILSQVPPSATHSDIRNLCFKNPIYRSRITNEDINEARERVRSSNENSPAPTARSFQDVHRVSILRSISGIRFIRSGYFGETGRVSVQFESYNQAKKFIGLCDGSTLGGSLIHAKINDQYKAGEDFTKSLSRNLRILYAMQKVSPDRTVLMKGFPEHLEVERLEKIIGNSYNLDEYPVTFDEKIGGGEEVRRIQLGPIVKIRNLTPYGYTSSFLIRTSTPADALRLVRRWHRVPWIRYSSYVAMHAKKEKEKAQRANQDSEDINVWDNFHKHGWDATKFFPGETDELTEETDDSTAEPGKDDEKKFQIPLIIDARMMY